MLQIMQSIKKAINLW